VAGAADPAADLLARVEAGGLIDPPRTLVAMLSGGRDSVCMLDLAVRARGAEAVIALHVDYGLRPESHDDAGFCASLCEGMEVELRTERPVRPDTSGNLQAWARDVRYAAAARLAEARDATIVTGHTADDQVETILYRLAARGTTKGIEVRREDGVVRPLLCVWREETEAFCRERGLAWRTDSSNPDTIRGLIREEIVPALQRIHPQARENVLRVLDQRRTMPPELAELLDSPVGTKRIDLGDGLQMVREHSRLWLESGPRDLDGEVEWGAWRIRSAVPGLRVRGWRPGDRLAGRSKKVQDVFVDAKIPRSDREGWPLVVRGDEVVAVPGIIDVEGVTATRVTD
jgi:tRNA(Ile)-lysidine synthetase-like protein